MITELGEECQIVIQVLDKIKTSEKLSNTEKEDSLAELLAAKTLLIKTRQETRLLEWQVLTQTQKQG